MLVIFTPFPDVTVHVIQPELVRQLRPHGFTAGWGIIPAIPHVLAPQAIVFTVVVSRGTNQRVAKEEPRLRPRPAGVFPFSLGRQSNSQRALAGIVNVRIQRRYEILRVVPVDRIRWIIVPDTVTINPTTK